MATPGKDKKLARDFSGSDSKQKRHQKSVQPEQEGQGFNHEDLKETVPIYSIAGCEKVIQGKNNQRIVLGRDRHGAVGEGGGYGHGHTHCGAIDIIEGPQAADVREKNKKGENIYVDPDFEKDAARIYISQKTDVDDTCVFIIVWIS